MSSRNTRSKATASAAANSAARKRGAKSTKRTASPARLEDAASSKKGGKRLTPSAKAPAASNEDKDATVTIGDGADNSGDDDASSHLQERNVAALLKKIDQQEQELARLRAAAAAPGATSIRALKPTEIPTIALGIAKPTDEDLRRLHTVWDAFNRSVTAYLAGNYNFPDHMRVLFAWLGREDQPEALHTAFVEAAKLAKYADFATRAQNATRASIAEFQDVVARHCHVTLPFEQVAARVTTRAISADLSQFATEVSNFTRDFREFWEAIGTSLPADDDTPKLLARHLFYLFANRTPAIMDVIRPRIVALARDGKVDFQEINIYDANLVTQLQQLCLQQSAQRAPKAVEPVSDGDGDGNDRDGDGNDRDGDGNNSGDRDADGASDGSAAN